MSLLITKSSSTKIGVRKKTLSQTIELGATSLVVVTTLLIAVLALVYLTHSNKTATRGYQLTQLKKERDELISQNEAWNLKIARVQSLIQLQQDNRIQNMIAASEYKLIRGDTVVAVK